MICVDSLLAVFQEKLKKTGSLDAALTKAVWDAYKQGLKDGKEAAPVDLAPPKWASAILLPGSSPRR